MKNLKRTEIAEKTVIVIPTYNCATQLARVLAALGPVADHFAAVWVIDNISSDDTVKVATRFQPTIGNLRVYQNAANISLGGTHKKAFLEAKNTGNDYVLILHGDDQALAAEAELMVDTCALNTGKTVLGTRFAKESRLFGYDTKRILGNKLLNAFYSIGTMRRLSDLGSGLNLFRLNDLDENLFLRFGNSLSFNYELILDFVRRNRSFVYVPITWREVDQVSNARNWRVFSSAVVILIRWLFHKETTPGPHQTEYHWNEISHV